MDSIMELESIVVPLGIIDTENLFGLHVKATKLIVFLFVSLDLTFVGFTALLPIQTLPLQVCYHKNHNSSSLTYFEPMYCNPLSLNSLINDLQQYILAD